jgi:hypothetical protein
MAVTNGRRDPAGSAAPRTHDADVATVTRYADDVPGTLDPGEAAG